MPWERGGYRVVQASKLTVCVLLCVLVLTIATPPVRAEVVYSQDCICAQTSSPGTTVGSLYVTADTQHRQGYYLTHLKVSWEVKAGDSVRVRWWDGSANELTPTVLNTSTTSVRGYTVTAPSGACTAQIELTSGSAEGNRYAWIKECTNNYNVTLVFVDPDIQTEPPPEEPPPEEPTTVDLTPVLTAIDGVSSQLANIGSDVAGIKSAVNSISSQLSDLASDMNSQFNAVKSRLDTISSDLAVVKNDVQSVKNYLTTPRTAEGLQVNPLPTVTFDSTVPDMSEPYQEPYEYDRPDPELPPAVFSPEPLPLAPDPEVMHHDEPRQVEQAIARNDPVTRDQPLTRETPVMDPPRQRDPVMMDEPLTREQPLTRTTPYNRENPLTPQNPLTPDPPLTPQPPLQPGG